MIPSLAALAILALSGAAESQQLEQEDDSQAMTPVRGIPEDLLPDGFDSLAVLSDEGMEDDPVLTVLGLAGGAASEICSVPFPGIYNSAKADWWWDGGRGAVLAMSQMPGSAFCFCASYVLSGAEPFLELSESWTDDPSAADVDSAALLLEEGDFSGAAGLLASVMYPGSYMVPGDWEARFLVRGHSLGLEALERGSPAEAASVMEGAFSSILVFSVDPLPEDGFASREEFEGNPVSAFIGLEEYAGILNDYGFLLAESGRHSEALPVLERVVVLAPDRAAARLNLADVLWETGDAAAAAAQYRCYVSLLEEKELMHNCPDRALERASDREGAL